MQKIVRILTVVMGLSICSAPPICAQEEKNHLAYSVKAFVASVLATLGGYGLYKYTPRAIDNSYNVYDYFAGTVELTRDEHKALIKNTGQDVLATIIALCIVAQFGGIALKNIGKLVS